jgi:hypothetical protein
MALHGSRRRAGRGEKPQPFIDRKPIIALLDHRRHLGEGRNTIRRGHRQRPQLAIAHLRGGERRGVEGEQRLPRQQPRDGLRRSAVRHMRHLEVFPRGEHHRGQMRDNANPRAGISLAPRIGPQMGNKISHTTKRRLTAHHQQIGQQRKHRHRQNNQGSGGHDLAPGQFIARHVAGCDDGCSLHIAAGQNQRVQQFIPGKYETENSGDGNARNTQGYVNTPENVPLVGIVQTRRLL